MDKEIKELQEKLGSGELSEEEFARVLERLTALQDLKLRLQMAVTGWIITMFAEMFGVELAAIVEASTEETTKAEDKKAEKTSLKEEANKEVREEIKVDEREKPKVPVFLFEVSPGFVRPIVLNKPELDLLPNSLKELAPKEVIKEEIREIKETKPKVEEERKAKPEPKKTAMNTTGMGQVQNRQVQGCDSSKERRKNHDENNNKQAPNQSTQGSVPNGKASNQPIPKFMSDRKASEQSVKNPVADCEYDLTVGFWNGPENESSVNNAQPPKGLTNDVKVEKYVEGQSVGKTS